MANLNCNATSCTNNFNECCCLNSIGVKGEHAQSCTDTCCGDYRDQRDDSSYNSFSTPKLNLNISCAATTCMYNHNSKCDADHVDISGIKATKPDDTVCATFHSKN